MSHSLEGESRYSMEEQDYTQWVQRPFTLGDCPALGPKGVQLLQLVILLHLQVLLKEKVAALLRRLLYNFIFWCQFLGSGDPSQSHPLALSWFIWTTLHLKTTWKLQLILVHISNAYKFLWQKMILEIY